jgi:uncharacterized protein with FMN-binding domain
MKYTFTAIFVFVFASCITLKLTERFNEGKYRGEGEGFNGPIVVEVETDSYSILNIKVIKHNEDEFISGDAMSFIIERILEDDSSDVDAVSGATQTSEGLINAVNNATLKAKKLKN